MRAGGNPTGGQPRFPKFRTLTSVRVDGDLAHGPQEELARGPLHKNFIGRSGVVLRKQLLTEIGPFHNSTVCCRNLDLWFGLAHRSGAL
jgi:hypothetical protein